MFPVPCGVCQDEQRKREQPQTQAVLTPRPLDPHHAWCCRSINAQSLSSPRSHVAAGVWSCDQSVAIAGFVITPGVLVDRRCGCSSCRVAQRARRAATRVFQGRRLCEAARRWRPDVDGPVLSSREEALVEAGSDAAGNLAKMSLQRRQAAPRA